MYVPWGQMRRPCKGNGRSFYHALTMSCQKKLFSPVDSEEWILKKVWTAFAILLTHYNTDTKCQPNPRPSLDRFGNFFFIRLLLKFKESKLQACQISLVHLTQSVYERSSFLEVFSTFKLYYLYIVSSLFIHLSLVGSSQFLKKICL